MNEIIGVKKVRIFGGSLGIIFPSELKKRRIIREGTSFLIIFSNENGNIILSPYPEENH